MTNIILCGGTRLWAISQAQVGSCLGKDDFKRVSL